MTNNEKLLELIKSLDDSGRTAIREVLDACGGADGDTGSEGDGNGGTGAPDPLARSFDADEIEAGIAAVERLTQGADTPPPAGAQRFEQPTAMAKSMDATDFLRGLVGSVSAGYDDQRNVIERLERSLTASAGLTGAMGQGLLAMLGQFDALTAKVDALHKSLEGPLPTAGIPAGAQPLQRGFAATNGAPAGGEAQLTVAQLSTGLQGALSKSLDAQGNPTQQGEQILGWIESVESNCPLPPAAVALARQHVIA